MAPVRQKPTALGERWATPVEAMVGVLTPYELTSVLSTTAPATPLSNEKVRVKSTEP